MTHEEQVKSPLYWNWVKAGLGLKYLKNGIETFVDNEVEILRNTFFHDISRDSGVAVAKCTKCTTANVIPCPTYGICNLRINAGICSYHGSGNPAKASKPDPNHVCNKLYHKIRDQHRYKNPSWKNTNAIQWCTNHWQIAKCFLPVAGYENKMSAAETDCSGLLNIAINCSSVQNGLDACITPPNDVLSKLVKTRNDILHSATLELTEEQLIHYVDQMIDFLQDKKKLLHDQHAQSSIHRLKQLKDGKFIISTIDEIDIRKSALIAIEEKKQEAIEEIESKKREVMDELNSHEKESQTKALQVHLDETSKQLDETSKQLDETSKQLDETSKITETMQASRQNLNTRQETVEATLDEFKTSQKYVVAKLREKISQLQIDILKCKSQLEVIGKMEHSHKLQLNYLSRKHELQRSLCSIYEKHLSTIPVSPLLGEINVGIDDVFVELAVCTDEIHEPKVKVDENVETDSAFKDRSKQFRERNPKKVKGYRDVLYTNEQRCKNVYLIGDAGMGKSTWCMQLLRTWVSAFKKQEDQSTDKTELNEDEKTISEFDVVLFASLRHAASDGNIRDMITHQVFKEHSQLNDLTTEFLKKEPNKCLIILDGLDEWSIPDNSKTYTPLQHPVLPGRKDLHGSTLLTTTRPWKLDAMRLKEKDIDRAVKIWGLENKELLVNRVIEQLNEKTKSTQNKTYEDFLTDAKVVFKNDSSFDSLKYSFFKLDRNNFPSVLNVPLILTYMVCLWFDEGKLETTLAANYSELFELLIANAEGDKASGKLGRPSNLTHLEHLKSKWSESSNYFPDCLQSRKRCKEYGELLLKLGRLAFDALLDLEKEKRLVFTPSLLTKSISDTELEVAVKIGILSQSEVVGGNRLSCMTSLSFLHKTIQEYLAALYIVCSTNSGNREAMEKYIYYCHRFNVFSEVAEMEDVLTFVCGMSPQIASDLSSVMSRYHMTGYHMSGYHSETLPIKLIDRTTLNELCWLHGRKSQVVTDWCTQSINSLKKISSEFKRVWAAFKPENENQIIFVVECMDRESAARIVLHNPLNTLDIEFIDINAQSKEDNDVMFSEEKKNKKLTGDELNKVNTNFFDISEKLLDQHSNLSIIQACSVKSTNYGKQSRSIIKETCIVLYVHAKGLIPIAEDQFLKEINGLPTDVREGTFHLYGKRSQEYYQNIRMGCQITGEFPKSGTLGAVVVRPNNRFSLIVPAHVVLSDTWQNHLKINKTIDNCNLKVYQPQQDCIHPHFGQIERAVYNLGNNGVSGYELALIDIIDPTRHPNTGLFPEVDFTHSGFTGMDPMEYTSGKICDDPNNVSWTKIIKYGSETEITTGMIEHAGSTVCRDMLSDNTAQIRLYNQIVVRGLAHRPFAQQGDSGALVFSVYKGNKNDLRTVGILAGGNSDGSCCYVTPINDALNAFGYNLWLAKFTPYQANNNVDPEPMEQ